MIMINKSEIVIRSTLLRSALLNPQEAIWILKGGQKGSNENMILGSLAHMMLLEPEKVKTKYLVYSGDKRGNDYKQKLLNLGEDYTLISENMYNQATEMIRVLKEELSDNIDYHSVKRILEKGKKEESIEYVDDFYKNKVVIKPDAYSSSCFLDYKTISFPSVNKEFWINYCRCYGLDIQMGLYYDILKKTGKSSCDGFYHLVQSTIKPYCVFVFFFGKEVLETCYENSVENALHALKFLIARLNSMEKIEEFRYDENINYNILRR